MGKITECYYEVIQPDMYDEHEAVESYYHQNVLGLHPSFIEAYEEFEQKQIRAIHKTVSTLTPKEKYPHQHPNMNSVIFGSSPMKRKVIFIMDK